MIMERLPVYLTVLFSTREQRVTGTLVFILTGISVFLAPVLKVRLCTLPRGLSAWETTGPMPRRLGEGSHMVSEKAGFY